MQIGGPFLPSFTPLFCSQRKAEGSSLVVTKAFRCVYSPGVGSTTHTYCSFRSPPLDLLPYRSEHCPHKIYVRCYYCLPLPLPLPRNCAFYAMFRFVSQQEEGPMFPLPIRLAMRVRSVAPMVQRMMSWMMSWMMHGEDKKVAAGKSLVDINKVRGGARWRSRARARAGPKSREEGPVGRGFHAPGARCRVISLWLA